MLGSRGKRFGKKGHDSVMQTVDKALLLKKVPEEVDDEIGE